MLVVGLIFHNKCALKECYFFMLHQQLQLAPEWSAARAPAAQRTEDAGTEAAFRRRRLRRITA